MGRTIIIGDVHGCARELADLLRYVGARQGDRIVFVGDLVVRGPAPHEVVALARSLCAVAVRGNHEDRLLRWRDSNGAMPIGGLTKETAKQLSSADWDYLAAMPLWLDLPEHAIRVVHAGLVPKVPMAAQDPRNLLFLRSFDERGEPVMVRGSRSWAHSYTGPEHVVFPIRLGENNDSGIRNLGAETGNRFQPAHAREMKVKQDDVRFFTAVPVPQSTQGALRRAELADQLHVRLLVQGEFDDFPVFRVVLHNHDADFMVHGVLCDLRSGGLWAR